MCICTRVLRTAMQLWPCFHTLNMGQSYSTTHASSVEITHHIFLLRYSFTYVNLRSYYLNSSDALYQYEHVIYLTQTHRFKLLSNFNWIQRFSDFSSTWKRTFNNWNWRNCCSYFVCKNFLTNEGLIYQKRISVKYKDFLKSRFSIEW